MRRFLLLCATVATLASCSPAIHLRNRATGEAAQCGPYAYTINEPLFKRQCISDFQQQGYERVDD
jgi:hypothetical protein